mgnify:CR=1 FL=1
MAISSKNIDIFGSFLTGPASTINSLSEPASSSDATEAQLLSALRDASQPVNVKQLVAQANGSITGVLKTLSEMEQFKLVKRTGDGINAAFEITELGRGLSAT